MPPVPSKPETVPWFKTGFIWEESDNDYVTDLAYTQRGYDVAFTYRLPSGLVEGDSYFRTSLLELPVELFTHFQPPPWKERRFNIASMISHCVPERAALVQEISEYMQIDQYGGCNPNAQIEAILPECETGDLRWPQQRCVIGHYRFYLVFENSKVESYVTEKLWQPLVMGAIPIYWGAPNVSDFLPDPDAIIRVSDFESIKDLTEYLAFLTTSETAYQKHMQWRSRPLPQHFLEQFDTALAQAPCKLCDLIAKHKLNMSYNWLVEAPKYPYMELAATFRASCLAFPCAYSTLEGSNVFIFCRTSPRLARSTRSTPGKTPSMPCLLKTTTDPSSMVMTEYSGNA